MPDGTEPASMASGGDSSASGRGEEEGTGGSSRTRYDSSGSSEENSEQGKRQRTGQGFTLPGIPASPPKFVSLEEIMVAANGMKNMVLAHEIAVDKDFKLERLEPPEDSVHKHVKDTLHKAFWDLLSQQLSETPPVYSQAMILLGNIKENLLALLLPQHTKLKQEINEVLDTDLISQQVDAGTLNFKEYAQYVVSVMGKMCAPARDNRIRELTQMTETVTVFKGILETLDLMKLDMANFTIKIIRPNIIATSIEYEKKKFAEFLKIQADGLERTREWLLHHHNSVEVSNSSDTPVDQQAQVNRLTDRVLGEAYLELLDWKADNLFPETLVIDEIRFRELGERVSRLAVVGAILLVTATSAVQLQGVASFKGKLMEHMNVLLADAHTDQEIEKVVNNVAVQVIKDVNDSLTDHGFKTLDAEAEKFLEGQILAVAKLDHKIRQLVRMRIREFLQQTITSPTAAPLRIPPGLSSLQVELTSITGHFLRLVSHNRAVFGQYYTDIIAATLHP